MIGTQLGRWVVDRELGKGAMGAVYFAHAADSPNEVRALKVLAPDMARDPVARDRFRRETNVLCQLDHPNIVRFDGAGTEGDSLYYVMEYIDGPDCETRLRDIGRWPWAEVLDVAIQITRGLKYAHDEGVVHRDLKPANVLLHREAAIDDKQKSTYVAKIADFGVARVLSQGQLTGSGHFIGTALYMAPEQAAGKPATKRSDFYALGCLMYTLLTGRPPFNGTSLAELVHKHQFVQAERPGRLLADLPHDLDELIVQLLSKDPLLRPADGSVLLKRLEGIRGKLDRRLDLPGTPFRFDAPQLRPPVRYDSALEQVDSRSFPIGTLVRGSLLLAALVVVIGLIVFKLTRPRPSAEELFSQAQPLMTSTIPSEWERAWSEFLEPMTNRYPNHPYEKEVAAFRQQLDDYQTLKRLGNRPRTAARSEAQRFYELGLQKCAAGELESGRNTWQQLIRAFESVESERKWVSLAHQGLRMVSPSVRGSPESADVLSALEKARRLRDSGQRDAAAAIWEGLEELYRDDTGGKIIVETIRQDRAKMP